MKQRYIYYPLMAGLATPYLIMASMLPPHLARQTEWSLGAFIFAVLLPLIPFVALVVAVKAISLNISGKRLDCIFWGGLLGVWGFTAWAHWTVWYPFYARLRVSSTSAIAFLFIPFYALVPM